MTYVTDPQKTYVIEPKEGEINYDLAKKNPNKFYDQVMKQDVREHKVQETKKVTTVGDGELPTKKIVTKGKALELKSRTTKRAVAKILDIIQTKLKKLVS